ncbi:hypothetical protein Bbelb_377570 [Branchiostoma belcheri]|nr:hypothetical protein Bbelb_377570 [Branchiostoma belcheri]
MSGLEPRTLSSESRTLPLRHTTPHYVIGKIEVSQGFGRVPSASSAMGDKSISVSYRRPQCIVKAYNEEEGSQRVPLKDARVITTAVVSSYMTRIAFTTSSEIPILELVTSTQTGVGVASRTDNIGA